MECYTDLGLSLLLTFILLQPSVQALLPSRCGQEATALTEMVKAEMDEKEKKVSMFHVWF